MRKAKLRQEAPLHLMLLVPALLTLIYAYGPMLGILIGFEDFTPSRKGFFYSLLHSPWVGLDHFETMLHLPDTASIFFNTVFIAVMKIAAKIFFPLVFALMLNEVTRQRLKKLVQTVTFLPYFLSWVILGGILLEIFSPRGGAVNHLLGLLGREPIYFFGEPALFPYMLVATDLWKDIGFNTIIFLATLTGIDPTFYEAAVVDGAGRWRQTLHITIPGVLSMVVLVSILSLGNVLNAGFDQVFMLYNPAVFSTGDILDTYTFRMGIQNGQYSLSTAVSLLKSVISLALVAASNWLAGRYTEYRVF